MTPPNKTRFEKCGFRWPWRLSRWRCWRTAPFVKDVLRGLALRGRVWLDVDPDRTGPGPALSEGRRGVLTTSNGHSTFP